MIWIILWKSAFHSSPSVVLTERMMHCPKGGTLGTFFGLFPHFVFSTVILRNGNAIVFCRYANYWTDTVNGTSIERRTLVKAFGIRFIFYVYGTAGRFNIVPFATNLGAGLALLGLVSMVMISFVLI